VEISNEIGQNDLQCYWIPHTAISQIYTENVLQMQKQEDAYFEEISVDVDYVFPP
jgi:hypothetical protein